MPRKPIKKPRVTIEKEPKIRMQPDDMVFALDIGTRSIIGIVGIVEENKIPVKFIGIGEQIDDMEIFDSSDFVKAII